MSGRLDTGDTVGDRWQVSHLLGSGLTGEVYEVYDVVEDRPHSLKLFQPEALAAKEKWDEFARTVRRVSNVLGPAGAAVIEVTVDDASGSPFVVSKRIDEPTLDARIASRGPLDAVTVAKFLAKLAPALDRAHESGVAHGNMKPTNVFLSGSEVTAVYLTDAGAQLLTDEEWGAPPEWCAPELMRTESEPSSASDRYALGLIVFYAMTGKPAFAAAAPLKRAMLQVAADAGLRSATARAAAIGARVDLRLDRWFAQALEPSPERRFGSVTEMARTFAELIGTTVEFETLAPLEPDAPRAKGFPPAADGGKRAARSGYDSDSSIAAVSVKPLLFSDDIPARRPSTAEGEAPPPEVVPDEDEARSAAALAATMLGHDGALARGGEVPTKPPQEETLRGVAPQGARRAHEASRPAASRKPAVRVSRTPPPPGESVAIAQEPVRPAAPPGTVSVPLPVLLAVGAAILGIGLAAIAAVLWISSSRSPTLKTTGPLAETSAAAPDPELEAPSDAAPPKSKAAAPEKPKETPPASPAEAATGDAATGDAAAGDATDAPPAGMARVRFTCTPVDCEQVFCDSKAFDPGEPLDLAPGKHVCKGAASGYAAPSVTLHLAEGRTTDHEFQMSVRKKSSSGKKGGSSSKKPCGTFINPCK